jgi:hypothetical protein
MEWIRRQRQMVVIAGVGVVVALATFAVTSARAADAPADFDFQNATGRPGGIHLSPYAVDVEASGFDLWTGEPHGWWYRENPHGLGESTERGPVPADIAGRRAIPLPLGFALGALVGLALVAVSRGREDGRKP